MTALHVYQLAIRLSYMDFIYNTFLLTWGTGSSLPSCKAKYVVLTTKHLKGIRNWLSPMSHKWSPESLGPHWGLVGELEMAVLESSILWTHHCFIRWSYPCYLVEENDFKIQHFVSVKIMPEGYNLANEYKPGHIWLDRLGMIWCLLGLYNFLYWLYSDNPIVDKVVKNDW